MNAPRMNDGNLMKEMDFTTAGIDTRWAAGLSHARQTLAQKSWEIGVDPGIGVVIHDEYVEMP
jgi:NTE family protein